MGPGSLETGTKKECQLAFISVELPVWIMGKDDEERTQQTYSVKGQIANIYTLQTVRSLLHSLTAAVVQKQPQTIRK